MRGVFRVSNAMLLRAPQVLTVLKATDEQKEQIAAYLEERGGGFRELFAELRKLEPDARRERMAEIRKKRAAEEEAKLGGILSEEQLAQLNGIRYQLMGFDALGDRVMITTLGINKEQGARLRELRAEMNERIQQLRPGPDVPREERIRRMQEVRDKVTKIREETLQKALTEVLTTDQAEAFKRLLGPPVKLDPGELFRGRFRRGGEGARPGGREGRRPRGGRARGGAQG